MDSYVLLKQQTTEFENADRRSIRNRLSELSEGSKIDFDAEHLSGTGEAAGFALKYEWDIEPGQGAYILTERRHIEKKWYYMLLIAVTSLGSIFLIFALDLLREPIRSPVPRQQTVGLSPTTTTVGLLLISVTLLCYGWVNLAIRYSDGLIPKTRGVTEGYTSRSPFVVIQLGLIIPVAVGAVGISFNSTLLLLTSTALLFGYVGILAYGQKPLEKISERSNTLFDSELLDSLGKQFPAVTGEYLISGSSALVLPVLLILLTYISGLLWLLFAAPILLLLSFFQINWFSSLTSGDSVLEPYFSAVENTRRVTRTSHQIFWTILTLILSYLLIGSLGFTIYLYLNFFMNPVENLLILLVVVATILPVLYFITGLLYQFIHWVTEKLVLIRYSSPFEGNFESSVNVFRLEKGRESPSSLSTVRSHYIFIPSYLIEEPEPGLNQGELEAVIAHEEKHIREREAFLFSMIPVFSILLFTGQNVIYGLLNFEEREFRADRYAAERTSEEAVISALQTMESLDRDVSKTAEDRGWWQDHFGLFFGTFAHSKAHPEVEERIKRLRENGEGNRTL